MKNDKLDTDLFLSTSEKIGEFISRYWLPLGAAVVIGIAGASVPMVLGHFKKQRMHEQTEKLYKIMNLQNEREKTIAKREEGKIKTPQLLLNKKKEPDLSKGDFDSDFKSVVEDYERLVQEFGEGEVAARAALLSADIYQKFEKYSEAADILNKVVGKVPSDSLSDVLIRMALSYNLMQTDKLEEAVKVLLPLSKNQSQKFVQAQALLRLGVSYLKLKNLSEARATFSKLTTEFAASEVARQAESYLRYIEFEGQAG